MGWAIMRKLEFQSNLHLVSCTLPLYRNRRLEDVRSARRVINARLVLTCLKAPLTHSSSAHRLTNRCQRQRYFTLAISDYIELKVIA